MKKHLTMTTAMAAALLALPGCSSGGDDWNDGEIVADRDTAICVDTNGTRVDDAQCEQRQTATGGYHGGGGGNGFMWYYLGRNSRIPYYGDSTFEPRFGGQGSYQPTSGVQYDAAPASSRMTRSAAVSRGGLGGRSRGGYS